jgi:hypothetical protein
VFNFGYQFWFLGPTIIILKIIIKFLIYFKGSMGIFIIYIGIIGPLFHFGYTKFKVPLAIKNNQFEWNLKYSSYACHLPCECD